MTNYDIKSLIPQREPILLVDALVGVEGDMARTQLTVRRDNSFVGDDGMLAEPGLIEHIAQSASAFAGYKAMEAGASEPPVGYIGEVKKFRCFRCPRVGEELQTTVTFGPEVGGVSLLTGETCVGEETLACTQMKIYVAEGSLLLGVDPARFGRLYGVPNCAPAGLRSLSRTFSGTSGVSRGIQYPNGEGVCDGSVRQGIAHPHD